MNEVASAVALEAVVALAICKVGLAGAGGLDTTTFALTAGDALSVSLESKDVRKA